MDDKFSNNGSENPVSDISAAPTIKHAAIAGLVLSFGYLCHTIGKVLETNQDTIDEISSSESVEVPLQ